MRTLSISAINAVRVGIKEIPTGVVIFIGHGFPFRKKPNEGRRRISKRRRSFFKDLRIAVDTRHQLLPERARTGFAGICDARAQANAGPVGGIRFGFPIGVKRLRFRDRRADPRRQR